MDKRTLFFVLALTISLFFVNTYFDQQRQESLQEWSEKHKETLLKKQRQVEKEILENTAAPSALPIVKIYADSKGENLLTSGIQTGENLVALSWGKEIPQTVFIQKNGSQPFQEYFLSFLPSNEGEIIVYQKQKDGLTPLQIGDLPDFGAYYLQLVAPSSNKDTASKVILASYVDGHFSLLAKQLEQINQDLDPSQRKKPKEIVESNALVLIKQDDVFLPVGVYNVQSRNLIYLDEVKGLKTILVKAKEDEIAASSSKKPEQFYVIESPYQQLVFSNYGGALAEINLPFASDSNKQSVVRQIEFDREMVEKHPRNAHFPGHPYYTPAASGKLEEHSQGELGGYYPLLRRNLVESGNKQSIRVSPRYYALNIVSEYPEVAELIYDVKEFDDKHIVFEAKQSHRRITKTFSIENADNKSAPYCLNLTIKIEGDNRGLWLTSGVPEVEWISGSPAPALKYRLTRNQKASVEQIDLPNDSLTVTSTALDWICNSNGFFGIIQDHLTTGEPGYRVQNVPGNIVPSRLVEVDAENGRFKAQDLPGYMTMLPLKATPGIMNFRIFAGPFADSILKAVDATYSDPTTGYNPDYIACQSFHGWFAFISEPFAKFLLILMKFFYQITGSWGFSIILLTVALRIMMYPLNAWSNKSMLRMKEIAPEVTAIQERFKKDPKQAQLEVMNLYRDRGVNPVSGCLPMLIQMPFLIGMFDLLKSTFELRGASFVPGWINDLASPDVLFSWTTPLFFIGNQFHLLPILLGVVMFLQQRLMTSVPKDPAQLTDQQRQQKAMGTIMTVVFTLMFYNFPSGLNIYWLSSMLLGMLQQWWSTRRVKVQTIAVPVRKTPKKP